MKKNLLLLALAIMASQFLFAQLAPRTPLDLVNDAKRTSLSFEENRVFKLDQNSKRSDLKIEKAVTDYNVLDLDVSALRNLNQERPRTITLHIPTTFTESFELELVEVDIFTDDFQVTQASDRKPVQVDLGLHYRGIIKGDETSIAAISIFEGEVMGLVSSSAGNLVIGKLNSEKQGLKHIVYDDQNVLRELGFECHTEDDGQVYTKEELTYKGSNAKAEGSCVRYYMEIDHDIYLDKGNTAETTSFVAGLMNEVATIYANEGLQTVVSEVFIWNVPSPYSSGSSSGMLGQFQDNTETLNGDLGQLLSYQASGGIAAGFSGLCNDNINSSLSFSNITSSFAVVPTYSWSVMVVSHEFGHLWGSRHTHACVWNGNGTAIDGCSGQTEGSCDLPGFPADGGTIMSYCHLQSVGINFTKGFGAQPGNIIRNSLVNAECLINCGPTSCDDGFLNGEETAVDCGGPDCLECPPTCDDGVQNGQETGVDCGGPDCPSCPPCEDGIQNGQETGVDCGGPDCIPCITCVDGIQNGDEEGIDCGGTESGCVACNGCLEQLNFNDFNTDLGIWIDGGSDCRRSSSDVQYSEGGVGSPVRLRDNSSSSVLTTTNLNLAGYSRVAIRFTYITVSFDSPSEDFFLQLSTDGGNTFTTVQEWNLGDEFVNETRYIESVEISWPLTATTQFRFRCDASDNGDYLYLDNIGIMGCDGDPVEPTCDDGIQNGQETGVDCGGPDCPACPTEPTCDDGIQNGQETGVDCGGPDCPACPTEPTCDDGIQNGQETGVDCGGPDCPACPTEPTCDDGIQNGQETGIDCGGPDCVPCSTDCTVQEIDFNDFNQSYGLWNDGGSDCTRSTSDAEYAVGGVGAPVRLRDNSSSSVVTTDNLALVTYQEITVNFSYLARSMDNPDEDFWLQISTDGGASFTTVEEWNLGDEFENDVRYNDAVTISGPFSNQTQIRFRCDASSNTDYVYLDDIRMTGCNSDPADPTCTDGIQNGQETGIDCGGPDCPACPTCEDGIQNGQETGVDCGGPDCPACPTEPSCEDGIQNGQETGVDCGGPDCPACPTCEDGIQNGQETGIDCGGPDCVPCSGECTTQLINFNDFNASYGIWNDGGSDCTRSTSYPDYAVGGTGAVVRLRDNSSSSVLTTDDLNLSAYQEITVDFTYIASSMDNPSEDFFLEISTNGGASFVEVEEWNLGDEFENEIRYFDAVTIQGPFSTNTQIRFRCDASSNTDYVYIDDVSISGCVSSAALAIPPTGRNQQSNVESALEEIVLVPNPVRDLLQVNFTLAVEEEVNMVVRNLQGQIISQSLLQGQLGINQQEINVQTLPAGIYILQISSKSGNRSERFVVEK